ncbi:23S rRNA (guanosine(2251)-2'-O)-methyltransferase RlmB [Agromyces rhizosphaerae]|uniref:23S rRNA (Guanosine(2251)-2'-O)-methyltransferase RlmB n=1 Tax=Agromyces rhizosphaerae TaxID=88374 RepID=A0A9W6FPK5_9MICO|nr:23S rRNA (guanosine(2251)-2'-O)-methyltransferase RlmB [Agromyces rhizosphaerae]GLI28124.1 23S rRNA (guanosine(2251)-2'-O)-methyltransferase RlmB [Agromyces rhizosphaerae]
MKGSSGKSRAGAVRKKGKGASTGTGGHGRKALEGKGPTPKAEDREYHPAHKRKVQAERRAAKQGGQGGQKGAPRGASGASRRSKSGDEAEIVTGRNAVVEALRAKIPASTLYVAARVEMDDRVREALKVATNRDIPIMEVMRPELDRLAGDGGVHQGLALKVPPYEYAHPVELLDELLDRDELPLLVALDGVTDPRNLGAIIRSTAAFGGQGVIVPQRRSAGVTAAAWRTSAGAAARVPVAMASNLTQTLKALKERGVFVLGLDGGGDVSLPGLSFADRPIVVVVGSEGKGLSRLVTETCDAIVSIPIHDATESLNAGIAASVTLYEVAKLRAEG